MYGLRERDSILVRQILADVKKSARAEIGIAGSLAQRALSPVIEKELSGTPLHDIDLLLLNTTDELPVAFSIHQDFHVYESHSDTGWYFGLTHRKTGIWVDLFTPAYDRSMAEILLDNTRYQADTIESQILYLAQDILGRAQTGKPIRRKWQKKLDFLMHVPDIDWKRITSEFDGHYNYFASKIPPTLGMPMSFNDYSRMALSQKPTTRLGDFLFKMQWYLWTRKNYMTAKPPTLDVV